MNGIEIRYHCKIQCSPGMSGIRVITATAQTPRFIENDLTFVKVWRENYSQKRILRLLEGDSSVSKNSKIKKPEGCGAKNAGRKHSRTSLA